MKKLLSLLSLCFVLLLCTAWQLQIPLGQQTPSDDSGKKARVNQRVLTGVVMDKNDQPIPNAVVYLKNEKTLNVRTFFAQKDGTYRFPQLERNVDYEVYAELDGKRSDTKTVSQFDDRNAPHVNLRINLNK
jgi:Carboxypeptidase regulatory-like domain